MHSGTKPETTGMNDETSDAVEDLAHCDQAEDVDSFDYMQAFDWLEAHDVDPGKLQDLQELKRLIKSHITKAKCLEGFSRKETDAPSVADQGPGEALMKEILVKDKIMKQELSNVYQALLRFVGLGILTDEIKAILKRWYDDYESTLVRYNSELVNDDCPIVVAGETSAGKSSLLNLLLGTDVLPHSLLCATATICRLHNCHDKRVEIESHDGVIQTIDLEATGQTSEALHKKLKPFISSKEMREKNPYKHVDIYWPIPLLQDRVTIVDTPGIGEGGIGDDMTSRLMSYLPNAVAFIYVINSSNSGGLQDDRLLHILNEQKRWEQEDKLAAFDSSCAIFVCNWWDQVIAEEGEEHVWKHTLETLEKFGVKSHQIFKMSTTEAARFYQQGMGTTVMFQNLLNGIERMVPKSLEAKVKRHYKWLGKFLEKLQNKIASRINHARATEEEKKKLNEEITLRLLKLKTETDKVREKLLNFAKSRCDTLEERLFHYLHQADVQERLCSWTEFELTDIDTADIEVTRYTADEKITKRVKDELLQWETEQHVIQNLSDELTIKFLDEFKLLGKECSEIDMLIVGNKDCDFAESIREIATEEKEGTIFSNGEKVVLAVFSPLWIPLVAAAAVLFFPVGIGMAIREQLKNKAERENFINNKIDHMQKWTKEHLENVRQRENLHSFVRHVYYTQFEKKIDEVCRKFIPTQISANERMMNDIVNDERTSREIYNLFLPIQNRLKQVIAKYQLFGLIYECEDYIPHKYVKEVKSIGRGNFSDVHLVKLRRHNEEVDAAMKVLRQTLDGPNEMYTQLSELDSLRKLKHPNIVEFYEVSYSSKKETDHEGQFVTSDDIVGTSLKFFFEFCDNTLQDLVFKREHLQCKRYGNCEDRYEAFKFYVTNTMGICEGLHYIHGKKYVHRDLKLSNVLVKGNVPKICDLGFSRPELLQTGTFVGTISHMAPEVIDQKPYDSSADIYYEAPLGILLWEFWYGEHAYSNEIYRKYSLSNLLESIRRGERPQFENEYTPVEPLQNLITECWAYSRTERPTAANVKDTLEQIFKDLYPHSHGGSV